MRRGTLLIAPGAELDLSMPVLCAEAFVVDGGIDRMCGAWFVAHRLGTGMAEAATARFGRRPEEVLRCGLLRAPFGAARVRIRIAWTDRPRGYMRTVFTMGALRETDRPIVLEDRWEAFVADYRSSVAGPLRPWMASPRCRGR